MTKSQVEEIIPSIFSHNPDKSLMLSTLPFEKTILHLFEDELWTSSRRLATTASRSLSEIRLLDLEISVSSSTPTSSLNPILFETPTCSFRTWRCFSVGESSMFQLSIPLGVLPSINSGS